MVTVFEQDQANFDLTSNINAFDFILEILYNLEQLKGLQNLKLDEKMKKAELLFSDYDTEKLIPLLNELIEFGYTKAKYMLALLYETGCKNLKRDDNMFRKLLSECISEGYLPALVRDIIPFNCPSDNNRKNKITENLDSLFDMADGDMFAAYEYARCAINFDWLDYGENDYPLAINMFTQSPKVFEYYGIAVRYSRG